MAYPLTRSPYCGRVSQDWQVCCEIATWHIKDHEMCFDKFGMTPLWMQSFCAHTGDMEGLIRCRKGTSSGTHGGESDS